MSRGTNIDVYILGGLFKGYKYWYILGGHVKGYEYWYILGDHVKGYEYWYILGCHVKGYREDLNGHACMHIILLPCASKGLNNRIYNYIICIGRYVLKIISNSTYLQLYFDFWKMQTKAYVSRTSNKSQRGLFSVQNLSFLITRIITPPLFTWYTV